MAAGDNTDTAIQWQPGEATGKNNAGATVALPKDISAANVAAGVPSAAPEGSPMYVNSANNKLYAWTGAAWVAVSGANT